MPWTNDLSNLAIQFLNAEHPPHNWTSRISRDRIAVYFFRDNWWHNYRLGRKGYPAFHWFAARYKGPNRRYCSHHQIVCATRLEVGLLPNYAGLPPLPVAINQWFNHNDVPTTRVAWAYDSRVKDIGTFRTLDETVRKSRASYLVFKPVDRPIFDPANANAPLPNDVWQQIECFFLRDPAVIRFLNIQ